MKNNENKKLAIYARQSREKLTNGSIDDQIIKGKSKADELGKKYELYVDKGISAAADDFENRPEFKRLLEDIKSGIIDSVFVIDVSRLTRNPITEAVMKQIFKEHKILVYSNIEGKIDFEDTNGEFLSGLLALLNRKHVQDTRIKIKGVLRNRAVAGKAHGGPLKPYGYAADENKNLVIDEEEAVIIREIFQYSYLGYGVGKIANILNDMGILTKGRKILKKGINVKNKYTGEMHLIPNHELKWKGNTILSILKNSLYKGERIHKGEIVQAPVIIDADLWSEVQKKLMTKRNKQGLIKHKYLLKGICICGRCGSNFVGRSRISKRDHYYYCASKINKKECGIRSLNIDYLEEIIWYMLSNCNEITKQALETVRRMQNPEEKLIMELNLIEQEYKLEKLVPVKAKLVEAYTLDYITVDELKEMMEENRTEIEVVQEKIRDMKFQLNDFENLLEQIDEVAEFQKQLSIIRKTASFETKHYLVRMFIDKIIIDFDDTIETYIISVQIKLPKVGSPLEFDLISHEWYLKKGDSPNLIEYVMGKDKFYQNLLKKETTYKLPEHTIVNGKMIFKNKIQINSRCNQLPPNVTSLPR